MKKIYIFAAVIALLTLSLNAQDGAKKIAQNEVIPPAPKLTAVAQNQGNAYTGKNAQAPTINQLLAGIKGMSSILPERNPNGSLANGQMRAPLKINADETTVGPFEGDNFSTNGIGYPTAYGDNGQQVYIFADMDRSKFADHDGDEIVGFRFALAGNSSQTAILYDFMAWPYGTSGYFEDANRHTWSIPQYAGAQPISSFDDIVIKTNSGTTTNFRSITVYDQNNNVLTSWDYSGETAQVTSGGTTYTYYVLPDGWTLNNVYLFRYGSGTSAVGYLSTSSEGIITIDKALLAGCTSVSLVINVYSDNGTETLTVNGDSRTIPTTTSNFTYNFSPTGSSAPIYMELAGGQWHEFYLDEPIVFNVADSIDGMYLGYRYYQYPSTATGYLQYPIAVNPQSTVTDHVSYRYGPTGTSTSSTVLTGWDYSTDGQTFPSSWTVPSVGGSGTLSGSLWFSGSSGGTFTIPASALQGNTTVTVKVTAGKENSNTHSISVNGSSKSLTQALVEYTWDNVSASNDITVTYSDYYVDISKIQVIGDVTTYNYTDGWWSEDFSQYGDLAVQLIFKSEILPPVLNTPEDGSTVNVGINEGSGVSTTITVSGENLTEDLTVSVSGTGFSVTPATISAADANAGTATVTVTYNGTDPNATGTLTISSSEVSATVNLTASYVQANPTIAISPENQTINDANAGALTVTGTDIEGNINVSAANDWSLNPNSLGSTGGQVSVSYTGRALSASTTVTATAANDNNVTATANVNYVADLYIVTDNGVTGQWDFNNGTQMTYNDGVYTATFTATSDNTFILFARMLGNDVNWNTRYVFGPDSNGDWWLPADGNGGGNLDLGDDDPIKIQYGGTYTITINANDGTFTITSGGTTEVPVLITPEDGSTVFVGTTSAELPTVSKEIPISGHYLTKNLTATISGEGFSFLTRDIAVPYADVNAATASVIVTYSGTDENATGTLTLSSDEVSAVVNLTASYIKPIILTTTPAGYVAQGSKVPDEITTAIIETFVDRFHGDVVSVTYVNSLGMTSDQPFDGVNIVVTRYSDGTTSTSKVIR